MATTTAMAQVIDELLGPRLPADAADWLAERVAQVASGELTGARFHMAFSAVHRRLARVPVVLDADEGARLAAVVPGLRMRAWQLDDLARTRLLLALPDAGPEALVDALDRLCADADLGELTVVYRALPLLPHPEALRARAAEGVRSNMTAVIEAVACDSPYPAAQLDDGAFGQLVLKCLFVGVPLHRVVGLDARITEDLAGRLLDYVRERRAASRPIPLELWRCVGPVARGEDLALVAQCLDGGSEVQRMAVALSLRDNPAAASLLAARQPLVEAVDALAVDETGSRWPALVLWPS